MPLKRPVFLLFAVITIFQLTSCNTIRKVPSAHLEYFKDSSRTSYPVLVETQLPQVAKIQKGDILAIVMSSLNKESNDILNFANVNTLPVSVFSGGVGGGNQPLGFAVDSTGGVSIPFIGRVEVAGLTLQGAEEKVKAALEKTIREPVVNIRFMNHKFSVLGEVGKVGTYNLLDDRTTILDAISLAGDLTVFGKRDSIKVIRTHNNIQEIGIVNLHNRSVFSSPYFYVKNGDIIYVEPTKNKVVPEVPYQLTPPPSLFLQRLPLALSVVSLVALFVNFFRR